MYSNGRTQVSRPAVTASKNPSNYKQLQEILTRKMSCTKSSWTYKNCFLPVHCGGKRCQKKSSVNSFFQQGSYKTVNKNTCSFWYVAAVKNLLQNRVVHTLQTFRQEELKYVLILETKFARTITHYTKYLRKRTIAAIRSITFMEIMHCYRSHMKHNVKSNDLTYMIEVKR